MINFISKILGLIAKYFISFIAILLILVVGHWFSTELKSAAEARTRLTQFQTARNDLGKELLAASASLDQRIQAIGKDGFGEAASQKISAILFEKQAEKKKIQSRSLVGLPSSVADFKRLAVLDMEISALKGMDDSAKQLRFLLHDLKNSRDQWEALSKQHRHLLDEFQSISRQIQSIQNQQPIASKIPGTPAYRMIDQLIDSEKRLNKQADELKRRIEDIQFSIELKEKSLAEASKVFGIAKWSVDEVLKATDEFIANEIKRHDKDFFWKLADGIDDAFEAQLKTAFFVLLGALLVPFGIKLTFFYVIAPLASRRPPIQVVSQPQVASPVACSGAAEVSLALLVKPGEEILVQADHLQSSSVKTKKKTRWFLNSSYPITSIVSGMLALTRIAPETEERVVVSSGKGTEMRLSAIELPTGAAIVLQPRCLVGVVQRCSEPVRIESVWRVFSVHSWLTLQFRYLVFHGPVKIIVKGSRGVHLEAAGDGRMINQSATLGFTASAKYSVRRCETFVAYWRGVEDLFNDQFDGRGCVYLYEEMPGLNRRSGITGRGLEGLTDAVLKVFGI